MKNRIAKVSDELVGIRQNRGSSLEHLEKYLPVMEEILDIYKFFNSNIEPQIRKMSFMKWK